jgi:hypothetical protein
MLSGIDFRRLSKSPFLWATAAARSSCRGRNLPPTFGRKALRANSPAALSARPSDLLTTVPGQLLGSRLTPQTLHFESSPYLLFFRHVLSH